MKKAQSLTLNTIVKAALVLIVIVVLFFMINKYIIGTGNEIGSLGSCENRIPPGTCKAECGPDQTGFLNSGGCGSDNTGKYCCIPNE